MRTGDAVSTVSSLGWFIGMTDSRVLPVTLGQAFAESHQAFGHSKFNSGGHNSLGTLFFLVVVILAAIIFPPNPALAFTEVRILKETFLPLDACTRLLVVADTAPVHREIPGLTQRAQYPLIKEYSLNHNMKPLII